MTHPNRPNAPLPAPPDADLGGRETVDEDGSNDPKRGLAPNLDGERVFNEVMELNAGEMPRDESSSTTPNQYLSKCVKTHYTVLIPVEPGSVVVLSLPKGFKLYIFLSTNYAGWKVPGDPACSSRP